MIAPLPNDRVAHVRYRICVYAEVNLTTGEVSQVIEDDESVRLDTDLDRDAEGVELPTPSTEVAADVVDLAPDVEEGTADLTDDERRRALEIAEAQPWPAWTRP